MIKLSEIISSPSIDPKKIVDIELRISNILKDEIYNSQEYKSIFHSVGLNPWASFSDYKKLDSNRLNTLYSKLLEFYNSIK